MLSDNREPLRPPSPPAAPYTGSHRRVTVRRPAAFTASVGAATVAFVAASAGAAVTMWPVSATSSTAHPSSAPAGNVAADLPHSAAQVMEAHAVDQALAVRAAGAKNRRLAEERAKLAAQRAAAGRAARLAAQRRAQLAAQRRAQQAKAAQELSGPAGSPQQIAQSMLASFGWGQGQWGCLDQLWQQESGWSITASNPSGAYGIPQALPGSKMASAGPDWQTDATTQIKWGLGYIQSKYGSPCGAWSQEESAGFY
jgi:hypothetical protein